MGCGGSKNANGSNRGWVAKKLAEKDALFTPMEVQWIAGNGTILNLNTKSMTLSKIDVSFNPISKTSSTLPLLPLPLCVTSSRLESFQRSYTIF